MAMEEVIAGEASVREIPTPTPFNYRLFALPEKNGSDWEAAKTHPRKPSSPRNPSIPYSPPYNGGDRTDVVFQWFWLSRPDGRYIIIIYLGVIIFANLINQLLCLQWS